MLTTSDIITEPFRIQAADGATIECEIDRPHSGSIGRCILLPAFGLTKLDFTTPAYYLLNNGFEVIRFDPTHHVGASDGEIADFTMTRLAADIGAVLDRCATPSTIVVSISLSSRAAFRALADRELRGLFLLSPVVNTRHTLLEVAGEDLISLYREGRLPEVYEILGFGVKSTFCKDCIDGNFADLRSTIVDVARLAAPTTFIVGSHDQWVDIEEVNQVAASLPRSRIIPISGANHQMFRSPTIIQSYLSTLLGALYEQLGLSGAPDVPRFQDVIRFVSKRKPGKLGGAASKAVGTP
jgi:pimeloyl-ACP methyl ester carboxylesterase